MSLIRSAAELTLQQHVKMLIYGQPGMGKTTLALSAPKPLLFDFDGGIHRVNFQHLDGVDTVQVSSWEDFVQVLEEDLSKYESLVIDTGGKCLDYMGEYIMRTKPKMKRGAGSLTLQGYRERKGMFSELIKQVSLMKKHIIFVAHRETKTEGDDTRYVPQFGGSNYDSLVTELDLVGYLEADGTKRTITFNPSSRNDGKNTCNLAPMLKVPVLIDADGKSVQDNVFLEHVIGIYDKRIQDQQNLGAKYRERVQTIREHIANISTAEDANLFIESIAEYNHVGNSKLLAAKELRAKAKALGLTFNKKTKEYEEEGQTV